MNTSDFDRPPKIESDLGFETEDRMNTAKEKLADGLLQRSGPLSHLLKHSSVSEQQQKELVDLIGLATNFSILCGITDKFFHCRLFDQLPLYGSRHSRIMELDASSKAAQGDEDVDQVLENRLVVLMLRPSFSYKMRTLPVSLPTSEHVIAKAIVVVAKKEAPRPVVDEAMHGGAIAGRAEHHLFSNLPPDIAKKLKQPFKQQFEMYDDDGCPLSSRITPVGMVESLVIKDE
ncbi:hypothetical protein BJX64DRAFT_295566 [Aspergillus heterothallicus]